MIIMTPSKNDQLTEIASNYCTRLITSLNECVGQLVFIVLAEQYDGCQRERGAITCITDKGWNTNKHLEHKQGQKITSRSGPFQGPTLPKYHTRNVVVLSFFSPDSTLTQTTSIMNCCGANFKSSIISCVRAVSVSNALPKYRSQHKF